MNFKEADMEFTKAEKERINQLYGKDFEDIKPDDAKLIARWEVYNALIKSNIDDVQQSVSAQANFELSQSRTALDDAMANLGKLKDLAVVKLKGVEDEQQKQA